MADAGKYTLDPETEKHTLQPETEKHTLHPDTENEKQSLDPEVEKQLPEPLAKAIRAGSVPEHILKHSHDADEAMQAFLGHEGEVLVLDEPTNKRILRRIDWNLIPIMCVVYMLNFLDKTAISYASIMGLEDGLKLTGNDYEWLASMFYFGYLGMEYPTSRLLQRLPIGKFSAGMVIAWGAVLSCFAACSNFGGAVAIRFFLGVTESAVTPGFALITSQWYTKREQGLRIGIWFSFNGWAQIFGGCLAYGIARGVDIHGSSIAPWKIIFLTVGLLTVVIGVIFLAVVPDNQLNARFLSKSDQILAVERIRINQQGVGNKVSTLMYPFRISVDEPQFIALQVVSIPRDAHRPNRLGFHVIRPDGRYTKRWHYQFLFPVDRILWVHGRAISPVRHTRWCGGDRNSCRWRLSG